MSTTHKRGRPLGVKNKPKKKPNFKIKELSLTLEKPFGMQLKPFRVAMGFSLNEIGEKMKCHVSNVCHFEKGDPVTGNSIRTAASYAKSLGVKQIRIIL